MWTEKTISIGDIKNLLESGYEIEVDSPDGWVGVNFFIDKGNYQEHILIMEDPSLNNVRCNADHLFETGLGWVSAKELVDKGEVNVLTRSGYAKGRVINTENIIPIVDINVEHENHRYYTEDVSSHNTGVGKTLFMTHCASSMLMSGKNVLYITMEMAEERIAERIDANLLDVTLDDLRFLLKGNYQNKIDRVKARTTGKLIVKEYPTGSASANHFRHLLNELKLKKNFAPDVIFIDYLNICTSARLKHGANVNSYTLIKAIAEELRGLAMEFNVPVMTATQTTRSGYGNSDVEITDTSECIWVDEKLELRDGTKLRLGDVKIGDQIVSNDGYKTVMMVHHSKKKECYKIKLKSGKEIIVSGDHVFPTDAGRMSINTGFAIGSKVNTSAN